MKEGGRHGARDQRKDHVALGTKEGKDVARKGTAAASVEEVTDRLRAYLVFTQAQVARGAVERRTPEIERAVSKRERVRHISLVEEDVATNAGR